MVFVRPCLHWLLLLGTAFCWAQIASAKESDKGIRFLAIEAAGSPLERVPAPATSGKQDLAELFPRYTVLDPNVSFWRHIFSALPDHASVVHSTQYLNVIFETLDFSAEASLMDEGALRRLKNQREKEAVSRIKDALLRVHDSRHSPQSLSGQERKLYAQMSRIEGDDRFKLAAETLRTQRGLRDRTRRALEISGKYLPYMESVFAFYGLPVELTRLPLVESSFNVEAYSKVGAAGLWQFIPTSARVYMRLNKVVDDRRDPWFSTDAAARHLRDDYARLGSWPLALTAYNHGRSGVARGLEAVGGITLADLIERYEHPRFGFASRNFYAEFLAAFDTEQNWKHHFGEVLRDSPLTFDQVKTRHYVPYKTLRSIGQFGEEEFRLLNPAYKPQVLAGKLYVPPGHLIKVPAGEGKAFEQAYASLGSDQVYANQRINYLYHQVQRGQTLSGIASRYGVSQHTIRRHNRIGRKGLIRVGQRLKIYPQGDYQTLASNAQSPSKAPSYTMHMVSKGQTVGSIARRYGMTASELRRTNRMGASNLIKVGQRLKVSGSRAASRKSSYKTHRVRQGQTLGAIARRYGVSIDDLRRVNRLDRSGLIMIGQRLKVPAG